MILNKLRLSAGEQKGFTLIEILVAVAIVAIIAVAVNSTILQLITVSAADRSRMEAVKELENTLHRLNRDGQQAWRNAITPAVELSFTDHQLVLTWEDFDEVSHTVRYYYDPDDPENSLWRGESGSAGIKVTRNIDPAESWYSFDGRTLTVCLTVTKAGLRTITETRTLAVIPRAAGN